MKTYHYTVLRVTNHLDEWINVGLVVVDIATKEYSTIIHQDLSRAITLIDIPLDVFTRVVQDALGGIEMYLNWDTVNSTLVSTDPTTWQGYRSILQFRAYHPVQGESSINALDKLTETFQMRK